MQGEKSTADEECESLTAVIVISRTTNKSKGLSGITLNPAETLDADDDECVMDYHVFVLFLFRELHDDFQIVAMKRQYRHSDHETHWPSRPWDRTSTQRTMVPQFPKSSSCVS